MIEIERDEAKHFLESHFQPLGLDLENTHINEINNVIDEQVVTSRTVIDEAVHWVGQGEEPTYDFGLIGVFSQPHSFAKEHREHNLRLPDLEHAIRGLIDSRS